MQITREFLAEIIESAIDYARDFTDTEESHIRRTASSIDRIAFGVYRDRQGDCGCPLYEAGIVDDNGDVVDQTTDIDAVDRFIRHFDSALVNRKDLSVTYAEVVG